jgi:hypothetical protein
MKNGRLLGVAALVVWGGALLAQDVPVETAKLGGSTIALHVQPFLSAEELAMLRLVMSNEQALALFVPSSAGHAALAVSPDDGFVRNGQPVASARALADLPDAKAAAKAALEACDAARTGSTACVIVLEIAPAG